MDQLVSIIVPVYNTGAYLAPCIESLIAQTYRNLEIILVDDGSTDGSGAACDDFARRDGRIRVIHMPHSGVTRARLTGAAQARGAWIGFLDGDDLLDADMYELLIRNGNAYDADISHCGYQMVFPDGRVHYFHNTGVLLQQDRKTALEHLLDGSLVEPGLWNKLYRRDLFDQFLARNQMDLSIRRTEDLLMNFLLFDCSQKSVFHDVCKYHYIVRPGSASRGARDDAGVYDPLRVKKQILELAADDVRDAAGRSYIYSCINTYNNLLLANDPHYNFVLPLLRREIRQQRALVALLRSKHRLLARMTRLPTGLHRWIYGIYVNHFQAKKYE